MAALCLDCDHVTVHVSLHVHCESTLTNVNTITYAVFLILFLA